MDYFSSDELEILKDVREKTILYKVRNLKKLDKKSIKLADEALRLIDKMLKD